MLGIESVQTDGHRDAARLGASRRVLAEGWFGGHGGRADCGQAESPEESSSVAPHGDLPFHGKQVLYCIQMMQIMCFDFFA